MGRISHGVIDFESYSQLRHCTVRGFHVKRALRPVALAVAVAEKRREEEPRCLSCACTTA
jgi:hypothetical protein